MATAHPRSNILDIQKQFNGRANALDAQGKELDEDQESSRTSWSLNSLKLQSTSSSSSVKWRRTTMPEFFNAPSVSTVVEHGSNCCETHIRSWWLFSFLFNSSDWATELTQSRRRELTGPPPHGHFSGRDRLSGFAALCSLSTSIICSFFRRQDCDCMSLCVPVFRKEHPLPKKNRHVKRH